MNLLRRSLVLACIALLTACAASPGPGQATLPQAVPSGLGGTVAMPDSFSADVAAHILSAGGQRRRCLIAAAAVLVLSSNRP